MKMRGGGLRQGGWGLEGLGRWKSGEGRRGAEGSSRK